MPLASPIDGIEDNGAPMENSWLCRRWRAASRCPGTIRAAMPDRADRASADVLIAVSDACDFLPGCVRF